MKKSILIFCALLLAFSIQAYSQKTEKPPKCKYWQDKTDEFTGEVVKATAVTMLFGNLVIGFRKQGTNYFVDFAIILRGEKNAPLKAGEELLFKLDNGKILSFKAAKEAAPTTKVTTTSVEVIVYSTFTTEYSCTLEDLNTIGAAVTTNIKVTIAGENYPLEISKGDGTKIRNAAYCVTQ